MPTEMIDRREPVALARLDPQALIAQAVASGAGIETLERLVALAKDVREVQAREAWYEAMAEFQRSCPPIKKTAKAKIKTKGGAEFTYKFAPLDEITSTIAESMGAQGLSISWRSPKIEENRVVQICRVSHTLGHHEESGEVSIPIETAVEGGSGANPAQRVGIAMTYGKRYSLLAIIGKAPEDDDDNAQHTGTVEGAASAAPAPADGPALVTDIETKTGTSKTGKPWTMYTIAFDDGRSGTTFSESLMGVAHQAKNFGTRVVPTLEQKGEYWNLVGLIAVAREGVGDETIALISKNQQNRLLAIARGTRPVAWTDEQLHDLLTARKIEAVASIPVVDYDGIIDRIKAGRKT